MIRRRKVIIALSATAVACSLLVPAMASGKGEPRSSKPISNLIISSKNIQNNSISSLDIKDLSILKNDLAPLIITNDKIAPTAVKLGNLDSEVMAKVESIVAARIAALSIPAGPRAYGRVKADGSVDSTVSSNIAARRKSTGKYCVSVTGVTDAAKLVPVVSAVNDSVAAVAVLTSMVTCNANEFGVGVYFSGMDEDTPFNVYVP